MHRGWLDPSLPGGDAVYQFVRSTAPWQEVTTLETPLLAPRNP